MIHQIIKDFEEQKSVIKLGCKVCNEVFHKPVLSNGEIVCQGCKRTIKSDEVKALNHRVDDFGLWVPYFGQWRLKDRYDILLTDGRVILQTYPNGGSFSNWNGQINPGVTEQRFEDNDVVMIRMVPDDELVEEFMFKGKERIKRNKEMFNRSFPKEGEMVRIDGELVRLI